MSRADPAHEFPVSSEGKSARRSNPKFIINSASYQTFRNRDSSPVSEDFWRAEI